MKTLIILCAPCGVGKSTMKDLLAECKQLSDFVCLDTDDFIKSQHEYSAWFKRNKGKFQCFIDNTKQTLEETAGVIEEFVRKRI